MEEFLALPELPAGKRELLRGKLIDSPPDRLRHTQSRHRVYEAFQSVEAGRDTYMEMGYKIGPLHFFQPAVSILHPDQPGEDYFEGAPLVAIEIASPAILAVDIEAKIEDYHTYGAQEVWVLYPDSRHLWVYAAETSAQRHTGVFFSQLLNGEPIDLDQILGG
jgi:Uma2 family endonuclease